MIPAPSPGRAPRVAADILRAMDQPGPTLSQRVFAVLQTRQFLVFYAIGLFVIDLGVPLASGWLAKARPIGELLDSARSPLADAVAHPGALVAALLVVYLLATTWLRAGYIRSLVGDLHLAPRDWRQFSQLLAFQVFLEIMSAAAAGVGLVLGSATTAGLALIVFVAINFAVMYADYVIVLSDVGPLRAIAQSWRTVRANFGVSLAVLLVVTAIGQTFALYAARHGNGGLVGALPVLVVECVVMGAIAFIADVTLVVIYLRSVETGQVPDVRR